MDSLSRCATNSPNAAVVCYRCLAMERRALRDDKALSFDFSVCMRACVCVVWLNDCIGYVDAGFFCK